MISQDAKKSILEFYNANKFTAEYFDSYLNPEKYFEKYSELLNVVEWRLQAVGELCDPPNDIKETSLP